MLGAVLGVNREEFTFYILLLLMNKIDIPKKLLQESPKRYCSQID